MWLPWSSNRPSDQDARARARSSALLLPHLDAAYHLARWLMRDPIQAQDVVQDALVRALAGMDGFRDGDAKSWLLRIVRNAAYDSLGANKRRQETLLDAEIIDPTDNAETQHAHRQDLAFAADTLDDLPIEWREALILREIEGLSYRDIAEVTQAPIGTVMSRLSRARQALIHARQLRDTP